MDLASKHFKNGHGIFIVDTGDELNLIKHKKVKTDTVINSRIQYHLFGTNEHGVETLGEVHLLINGVSRPFQIVANNLLFCSILYRAIK